MAKKNGGNGRNHLWAASYVDEGDRVVLVPDQVLQSQLAGEFARAISLTKLVNLISEHEQYQLAAHLALKAGEWLGERLDNHHVIGYTDDGKEDDQ